MILQEKSKVAAQSKSEISPKSGKAAETRAVQAKTSRDLLISQAARGKKLLLVHLLTCLCPTYHFIP